MAGQTANNDVPTYYRDSRGNYEKPTSVPGQVAEVDKSKVPQPGRLCDEAKVSSAGPVRALFGKSTTEVEVPCAVSPLGVINQAVRVARNDYPTPMYVRIRMGRNTATGTIGVSGNSGISGLGGSQPMEWLNLTTEPGQRWECVLQNSDELWAIGTWVGVVPLSVFLSVATWNP